MGKAEELMLRRVLGTKLKTYAAMAAVVIFTAAAVLAITTLYSRTFYKGIYVEQVDISGKNIIDAKRLVEEKLNNELEENKIILVYGEKSWQISPDKISLSFKTEEALKNAYQQGRQGSVFKRLYDIVTLRRNNFHTVVEPEFDISALKGILEEIKAEVDKPEADASVNISGREITFREDAVGYNLDIESNCKIIEGRIKNKQLGKIELLVEKKVPRITYEAIKDINKPISTSRTRYNASNYNRSYNIRIACEKINNTILMPGDVFSMDKTLGARTSENGYREAPVIIKNELINGIGGGVCQVTTTLYVAVLKAMLEVVERTPHSLPLGYVPPGQDATIAENSIDFKFKNNLSHPIFIGATASGGNLDITIFGISENPDYSVRLRSKILKVYKPESTLYITDNSVPPGVEIIEESPQNGYRAAVYRDILDSNGNLVRTDFISEDDYKPVRGRIRVNESYFSEKEPSSEAVPSFVNSASPGIDIVDTRP